MTDNSAHAVARRFPRVVIRKRRYVSNGDMLKAGYPHASIGLRNWDKWTQVHDWCKEMFGETYLWAGDDFFFQNDEDLAKFLLVWG